MYLCTYVPSYVLYSTYRHVQIRCLRSLPLSSRQRKTTSTSPAAVQNGCRVRDCTTGRRYPPVHHNTGISLFEAARHLQDRTAQRRPPSIHPPLPAMSARHGTVRLSTDIMVAAAGPGAWPGMHGAGSVNVVSESRKNRLKRQGRRRMRPGGWSRRGMASGEGIRILRVVGTVGKVGTVTALLLFIFGN